MRIVPSPEWKPFPAYWLGFALGVICGLVLAWEWL